MALFKKRIKIDDIKEMFVSGKRSILEFGLDAYVYNIHLEECFTKEAKEKLKPVVGSILSVADKKLVSNDYWLILAEETDKFAEYTKQQRTEIAQRLLSSCSSILYAYVDISDITILLRHIDEFVISALNNIFTPNGTIRINDLFGTTYLAIPEASSDKIISTAADNNLSDDKKFDILFNEAHAAEFVLWYIDFLWGKGVDLQIGCDYRRKDELWNCMVEAFSLRGVNIEFNENL